MELKQGLTTSIKDTSKQKYPDVKTPQAITHFKIKFITLVIKCTVLINQLTIKQHFVKTDTVTFFPDTLRKLGLESRQLF